MDALVSPLEKDMISTLLISIGLCHLSITVCNTFILLYFTDATAYSSARFGQGTGPIHLDNVACTGTEDALVHCAYVSDSSDCFHFEDAGVLCQGKQLVC